MPPPAEQPLARTDKRYDGVSVPVGESLSDVEQRVKQAFTEHIVPQLKARCSVLLVSHGNALRTLIRQLDEVDEDDIEAIEVPTATPIYYELNSHLKATAKWPLPPAGYQK